MVFSPEGAILAETENQKVMKKILEVLQYGETDIRFNTDVDPAKDPEVVTEVIAKAAMAMTTKLWGGNEQAVIAMIRACPLPTWRYVRIGKK